MAETQELPLKGSRVSSTIELDLEDPMVFIIMKALASKTRLQILTNLKQKMDVCETAKKMNQTEANISAQIKILEQARLITPRYEAGRHGVKKICEPNLDRIIINI
ncbi:MAG TPA: ArsR family transcriptional regulator [Candidatus Deferrimicrobium sp.]|nr:ArsR family transcriptional regulator [Candidatus Deferrimicrobium sp.]